MRSPIAALLLLASSQALALPITYNYSGIVTSATGAFVGQGSAVTGTFTFDDQLVDWLDTDPYTDEFRYITPDGSYLFLSATITVGGVTLPIFFNDAQLSYVSVTDGPHFYGCDDLLGCNDAHDSFNFQMAMLGVPRAFRLSAHDGSDTAINPGSGTLTSTTSGLIDILDTLDLSRFDFADGACGCFVPGYGESEVSFTWTGLSRVQEPDPPQVPEPTTLSLLAIGLLGALSRRTQRRPPN